MSPIIDRTQVHDQVTLPGDPTMDCDIEGIVVTSVVVADDDQEILMHLRGGHGQWADTPGEMVDIPEVTDGDVRARFVDMPEHLWRRLVAQLERWRDAGTPLWFGSAPGKISTLIEDPDHYVFLPRREDPLEC